jgi:triosephosphate isomerase
LYAAAVILAYEPRWAIGAAAAAPPGYVAERHRALRSAVEGRYGAQAAAQVRIVYGGSVTPDNGEALMAQADVDGLFVGRAAWTPEGFAEIAAIVARAAMERAST